MNPNNLNLYIVDDDKAMRHSLAMLFLAHLDGVAVQPFDSGEAFLQNAKLDGSGVAILDLRFEHEGEAASRMNGLEVFHRLKERCSPLVVVFLSGHGTIPDVVHAMQDGAVSWLQKPCSEDVMLQTVSAARDRARSIAEKRRDRQIAVDRWSKLTQRETEVAALVARGQSAKVIGQTLTKDDPQRPVEFRTVEAHRARVFAKLEVANANELQEFMVLHNLPPV
jgi:FixJ family two-component response regulator